MKKIILIFMLISLACNNNPRASIGKKSYTEAETDSIRQLMLNMVTETWNSESETKPTQADIYILLETMYPVITPVQRNEIIQYIDENLSHPDEWPEGPRTRPVIEIGTNVDTSDIEFFAQTMLFMTVMSYSDSSEFKRFRITKEEVELNLKHKKFKPAQIDFIISYIDSTLQYQWPETLDEADDWMPSKIEQYNDEKQIDGSQRQTDFR
jgi:hypothetical protein